MAVIFVEGFDYYNGGNATTGTSVGLLSRWQGTLNQNTMVAGRFGGQAVQVSDSNGPINANMPSTYNSGCFGFALYTTGGYTGTTYGLAAVSTAANGAAITNSFQQFYLNVNTSGQIQVYRGNPSNSLLATSTATITFNAWNYIEVEFVISDTVGEVRVYLNNNPTPIINLSGVDNKGMTTSGFNWFVLSDYTGANPIFDDIYVTDTPVRLGEQRVVTTYPNADVSNDFWTSSTSGAAPYTMVDETTCDADTTYVSSNTANSRVVFSLPSLSVPPINVNAVQIVGFARKDETQFRQIALEYQNTAGAVNTGPTYTLGTSYAYTNNLYNQNPLTGTSWTATDINTMRIGARVAS